MEISSFFSLIIPEDFRATKLVIFNLIGSIHSENYEFEINIHYGMEEALCITIS